MSSFALGIDIGTGSTKVTIIDSTGGELTANSAPVALSRPQPGWVESDPEDWWQSLKGALQELPGAIRDGVAALGLSGQMHGVVLAGPNGAPLRPAMLWLDRRAEASLDVYRSLPQDVLTSLGNPLFPGAAGPMLHWLAAHEPAALRAADWALQPKDWLRLRLVGHAGTEPSDASGTLLFDIFQNCWAQPVVDSLGIPARLLAPLGASDAVAGTLKRSIADELGLPSGIPVAYGSADTAAALLGTGLLDGRHVQVTVGTAAQVVALRPRPSPDPGLRYHVFVSAIAGRWYALAAVQAAGVALSWALGVLGMTWEEAYELLGTTPNGANGVLFLPHLAGARSPSMDSSARAAFLGLELRHHRADVVRAVFEGVAFSIADAAKALPEFAAAPELYLAGGGSLHPRWRQLLCDVLGKRLRVVENPNASARGAALLGARSAAILEGYPEAPPAAERVDPEPYASELLAAAFEHWKAAEVVPSARSRAFRPGLDRSAVTATSSGFPKVGFQPP